MDTIEVEENVYATGDAQLHGGMCRILSTILGKVLEIFPTLEATRPRSKSGIQALCSLHVALDKAKSLLQHCSSCSKLYLAVTADSIQLKFEKIKFSLQESLRSVVDIVPQATGFQIMAIVAELQGTVFELDHFEKSAGDEVIQLLQIEKKNNDDSNDVEELESFHQAVVWLGITSARAALTERRALKDLIGKAHVEQDKRKESIVLCLLNLMRKYSRLFRTPSEDADSQGSTPCTPTGMGAFELVHNTGRASAVERQLSKMSSFYNSPRGMKPRGKPAPPEELRCPISLQLMYDPVIISSGQTYERVCIEKWFSDGHRTCPKTQQELSHLFLTPNYCVKGLVASWCEQNGVAPPESPPESLSLKQSRLSETEVEDTNEKMDLDSCNTTDDIVVSLDIDQDNEHVPEDSTNALSDTDICAQDCLVDLFEKYRGLLLVLHDSTNLEEQLEAVEQIRLALKTNDEARIFMGKNGFSEALIKYLQLAVQQGDNKAQEVGAMALFNFGVNNDRNKELLLSSGVIPLLEEMIDCNSFEAATALYLNLSLLDDAKSIIGASKVVPRFVQLLSGDNSTLQCQIDALDTLYNLSSMPSNVPSLISAGIVGRLYSMIINPNESLKGKWLEKSIAILANVVPDKQGKKDIVSSQGLVSAIAAVLDVGELAEKEQALSFFLVLCEGDPKCIHAVLQEGVIPALVSATINGTTKGKDKAQKLLMLFREQRQRDPSPSRSPAAHPPRPIGNHITGQSVTEPRILPKSSSRRLGRTITAIWRSKNFSMYR